MRGRDAGDRRTFDPGMAVATVEVQPPDMVLVTEWNGLVGRLRPAGHVLGSAQPITDADRDERHDQYADQNGSSYGVGKGMKYVRHLPPLLADAQAQTTRFTESAPPILRFDNGILRLEFLKG
jgi:hypothetical protein